PVALWHRQVEPIAGDAQGAVDEGRRLRGPADGRSTRTAVLRADVEGVLAVGRARLPRPPGTRVVARREEQRVADRPEVLVEPLVGDADVLQVDPGAAHG